MKETLPSRLRDLLTKLQETVEQGLRNGNYMPTHHISRMNGARKKKQKESDNISITKTNLGRGVGGGTRSEDFTQGSTNSTHGPTTTQPQLINIHDTYIA